jgi:hypothetical protein
MSVQKSLAVLTIRILVLPVPHAKSAQPVRILNISSRVVETGIIQILPMMAVKKTPATAMTTILVLLLLTAIVPPAQPVRLLNTRKLVIQGMNSVKVLV